METWIRVACRQRAKRQFVFWIVTGLCLAAFLVTHQEVWSTALWWTLAAVLAYGLLFWRFALRALRHLQDIATDPVVRRVESYPNALEIAAQSERESLAPPKFKKPGILVTENFVIKNGYFSFHLFLWNDLLWAYAKVTRRSVNLIPIGSTSEALLYFRDGSTSIPARKKVVDAVLLYAAERAPWAIFGFSDELLRMWNKDAAQFRGIVENRKGSST